MLCSDFDYHLPAGHIAQVPADRREDSRLLCVPRSGGAFQDRRFVDLVDFLRPDDLLVLNDTRVIPARLFGHKHSGGKVELLLDRPLGDRSTNDGLFRQEWAGLVRSSKPLKGQEEVVLPGGALATYLEKTPPVGARIRLQWAGDLEDYLCLHGQMPLPHYIHRNQADPRARLDLNRYQTVFARAPGAIAAPTAGLHFTRELLNHIAGTGVRTATVTLHVGPGTFLPVRTDDVDDHVMHSERYQLTEETVAEIQTTRKKQGRVVAVGTTVVRTLESCAIGDRLVASQGETNLFIRPGFPFRVVDALLTNFHLPRSTLLMLVCAFSNREHILHAYRHAVEKGYRFYSYGDAMWIA